MAIINGTAGNDGLAGTESDDTIEGFGGDDTLSGFGGNDTIRGGEGNDGMAGLAGDDTIEGGGGDDYMDGGAGDDRLDGGEGRDNFDSFDGDDVMIGGAGNDVIRIARNNGADHLDVDGGADDDIVSVTDVAGGSYDIDLGTGNDRLIIYALSGDARLTLGAGRDVVELTYFFGASPGPGAAVVADFTPGDAGDRIEFLDLMSRAFTNWNHALSPFATGHARLLQQGADVLLQLDYDGGGNGYVTILTFENVGAASFTADNLNGYPADGTLPAGRTVAGSESRDNLYGAAGADTIDGFGENDFLLGGGGNDLIRGGGGHDQLYGEIGNDQISGGGGGDFIDGGYGADTVDGGTGDDFISSRNGADLLGGGEGNDSFLIERDFSSVELVKAAGGAGDDRFDVYSYAAGTIEIDGGADDDIVSLRLLAGAAQVTLGTGADRLLLSDFVAEALATTGFVTVTDFSPDVDGDVVDMNDFTSLALLDWDGSENPFGAGYLRLVQDGDDALLEIDQDGGGNSWRAFVRFEDVLATAFTAASFGGFAPDGSPPPGQTIVGTESADVLTGGGGADTIDGLGGSDDITGGAGDDIIRGGLGNDTLRGGSGDDRIEGGDDWDSIDGGFGDDILLGGGGDDNFLDNAGSDSQSGGDGNDSFIVQRQQGGGDEIEIFGDAGDDVLHVNLYAPSTVEADMGSGEDVVSLGPVTGSFSVRLGAGADRIVIAQSHAYFGGGSIEVVDFNPAAGGDVLDLLPFLREYLTGWDDSTNPFATGFARLVQTGTATLVQVDADGAGSDHTYATRLALLNVPATALGVSNLGFDVKAMLGSAGSETFTYTSLADFTGETVDGGGGSDRLVLNGVFTNVQFSAATMVNVETLKLVAAPAGGFNRYNLNLNDNNVAAGQTLIVDGSTLRAGETLGFSGSAETDGRFVVTAGGGNDSILGGRGNDVLAGGAGSDTLRGNAGNDRLDGGSGDDTLAGSLGDDLYIVDNAFDRITELADQGNDEVSTSLATYSLLGTNLENLKGNSAIAHDFRGNAARNILTGNAGDDILRLMDRGNDSAVGAAGNDRIAFGAELNSLDYVDGGAGTDQLFLQGDYTGANALRLGTVVNIETLVLMSATDTRFGPGVPEVDYNVTMNNGNVASGQQMFVDASGLRSGETLDFNGAAELDGSYRIVGGQYGDIIRGGAQADNIRGALGKDTLTGNGGGDTFAYTYAGDSSGPGYDTLTDLNSAQGDKLDLHSVVSGWAASVNSGQLNAASFNADLAAAVNAPLGANQAILFTASSGDQAGKTFLVVDGNGDGAYVQGQDYVFLLGPSAAIDTSSTGLFV